MNPISAYLVHNIVGIFFLYGLAFFVMGLALALAQPSESRFEFSQAIWPLAAFGLLHGLHEWFEMFQKIAAQTGGRTSTIEEEIVRLIILSLSFLMLAGFGIILLKPQETNFWRRYWPIGGLLGLWTTTILTVNITFKPAPSELITIADVLIRYSLGIPATLLGTWALMSQQHVFRQYEMPQFSRHLVWCAAAMFLYGVVGQLFVKPSPLPPSTLINDTVFLQWFGIPVQLFRGSLAAVMTFYMVRVLRAFALESQQRLEQANQAKLTAQATALEAERSFSQSLERLNAELQLTARELLLLLELTNLLAKAVPLPERLQSVLEQIVQSLNFPQAGLILLVKPHEKALDVQVQVGFTDGQESYRMALELSEQCINDGLALCCHSDGQVIRFSVIDIIDQQGCRRYESPITMLGLPLTIQQRVIGGLVLAQATAKILLTVDEFNLITGIAQQLGLSIENVRLYQEAQKREKQLGELLHQVVTSQETERKRIARELHDATGQSLTAMALGLSGIEAMVTSGQPVGTEQVKELKTFGMQALGELRQLISDLRPPQLDDLGLADALQWYVQAFEKRHPIAVDFIIEGEPVRLPSEYETVLFRIAQEALTNVAKHAEASQVRVKLEMSPGHIQLTVEDDGRGFDPREIFGQEGHLTRWGLLGIGERTLLLGGQYEINSKPGAGTCIWVKIPLNRAVENVKDKDIAG